MKKMKKLLVIVEGICSIGLLVTCTMLFTLRNTISYEKASAFDATPKSSLFVIMEHNHILGYLFVFFGAVLAVLTVIRLFNTRKNGQVR